MYKIYDGDGQFIGFSDDAKHVNRADNGCLVECKASEAEGIAFQGEFYEGGGAVKATNGVSLNELQTAMGAALEKQQGDIEYIAMMSDIELDTEV